MNATIITASEPIIITKHDHGAQVNMYNNASYIAGSNAGICYMRGNFFDEKVSGMNASIKRCSKVLSTNHHSIANHAVVEILFEDISKAAAMVLNNFKFYATSEKSGRYTVMTGSSVIEREMYDKWREKLNVIIKKEYPNMDDGLADKLAMENARLFISANAPIVTMGYSASINQWSYIAEWFDDYYNKQVDEFRNKTAVSIVDKFKMELANELHNISIDLRCMMVSWSDIKDPKHRTIDPFGKIITRKNILTEETSCTSTYKATYKHPDVIPFEDIVRVRFNGSFAMVAQLQRHRTLDVQFELPYDLAVSGSNSVFTPDILIESDALEWMSDMNKLFAEGIIPIGTNLVVRVTGSVDDYQMMFDERLCCRAQYEIMMWANAVHESIFHQFPGLYPSGKNMDTKCQRNGGCKEPCMFIKDGLVNKKI